MGIFDDILEKLGLPKKPVETPAGGRVDEPKDSARGADRMMGKDEHQRGKAEYRGVPAISEADVVKKLETLSGGNDNWKVSIVELLSLLGIDSSRENRNALAVELGCPPELMEDSAKMNMWLHKKVLKKIANHGGNIPPSLLD